MAVAIKGKGAHVFWRLSSPALRAPPLTRQKTKSGTFYFAHSRNFLLCLDRDKVSMTAAAGLSPARGKATKCRNHKWTYLHFCRWRFLWTFQDQRGTWDILSSSGPSGMQRGAEADNLIYPQLRAFWNVKAGSPGKGSAESFASETNDSAVLKPATATRHFDISSNRRRVPMNNFSRRKTTQRYAALENRCLSLPPNGFLGGLLSWSR
jgi:hypothetical protein